MKKYIFKSLLVLFAVNISFSQTTATNFTTNDCNGVSHHLFDELDNGNVVVIAWVMPCTPCATYSLPAYSAVELFATSHPGQVHFYMADDYANTSCSSLSSWGDNYNMSNSTFFSSTDVNMNDYGVAGMPKVVVLGGLDHHVYFNENDNKIKNINDKLRSIIEKMDTNSSKIQISVKKIIDKLQEKLNADLKTDFNFAADFNFNFNSRKSSRKYKYKCVVSKTGNRFFYKRSKNNWKRITNKEGLKARKSACGLGK